MLVLAELILSPSISSAMVLSGLPRLQNGKFSKKHSIGNNSVYKSNGNDTEKVRYLTPVLTPPLPTAAFTNSSLTTYSSFFLFKNIRQLVRNRNNFMQGVDSLHLFKMCLLSQLNKSGGWLGLNSGQLVILLEAVISRVTQLASTNGGGAGGIKHSMFSLFLLQMFEHC